MLLHGEYIVVSSPKNECHRSRLRVPLDQSMWVMNGKTWSILMSSGDLLGGLSIAKYFIVVECDI